MTREELIKKHYGIMLTALHEIQSVINFAHMFNRLSDDLERIQIIADYATAGDLFNPHGSESTEATIGQMTDDTSQWLEYQTYLANKSEGHRQG